MPPFAGTDSERAALAAFLATVPVAPSPPADGKTVFERNCSMCHRRRSDDALFARLPGNPQEASNVLKDLPNLFIRMPDLKLSDQERSALVDWVNEQRSGRMTATAAPGGN
jgi:mono/diheme cytochrome c family protein